MPELPQYPPSDPFPGTIGRTLESSEASWPALPGAPDGAPNVVLILLDDVGYGQLSTFGGLCETPTFDRLATRGLRYNNFHTTALCSPTRACLLTGRNHHTVGMSAVIDMSLGYPAHNATIAPEHGMLSEILRDAGYNTFAVGKWHLTPNPETTAAGPFDRWPLGKGFERYYGFLGGDTDQFHPDLTSDNHWVPQPATPAEGYHLNADLADKAIDFIADADVNAPDKPFFLYFATGAGHAPHQVEREWADRYAGAFDGGWDEYRETVLGRQRELGLVTDDYQLAERDPDVPAWDSLSDDAKRMYSRQMEVYAGFISQTDHHVGRVIEHIEALGRLDNTIVVVASDNGASAEGGEHGTRNETLFFNQAPETLEDNLEVFDEWGSENTFNHYAWGWAWAGDTPFRRWKRETYRGGVSDPCIISWPAGSESRGEVREQYCHAIDIAPTVLAAIGIDPPAQIRGIAQSDMHGASLLDTARDAAAPTPRATQYFEMMGHRSIYHDGWKAVCPWPGPSLTEGLERGHPFGTFLTERTLDRLEADDWELYDLAADPTECHDLAEEHPGRLAEMRDLWWSEAERYGALPLGSAGFDRLLAPRPRLHRGRTFRLSPFGAPVPNPGAPRTNNRSHAITAEASVPEGGVEGVIVSHGNRQGGIAFFVHDRRLHYVHNYLSLTSFVVAASVPVPAGDVRLRVEVESTGEGDPFKGLGKAAGVRLFHDDDLVGAGRLPYTVPNVYAMVGMSCGYAAYDTVDPSRYEVPFRFTGGLSDVVIDLTGELTIVPEAELNRIMAQQ